MSQRIVFWCDVVAPNDRWVGEEKAPDMMSAIRQALRRVRGSHIDLPFNPTNLYRVSKTPLKYEYLGAVVEIER